MTKRIDKYVERAEEFDSKAQNAAIAAHQLTLKRMAESYRMLAAEAQRQRDFLLPE